MTIEISNTFILWLPVIIVGVLSLIGGVVFLMTAEPGGGVSGTLDLMAAIFGPLMITVIFTTLYFAGAYMGHKFWP